MAYDLGLEKWIDTATADWGLGKKRMFSGLSYFIDDKICFAVRGGELMIRVDKTLASELLGRPGIHEAVMGKRVMKNWVQAGEGAIATDEKLLELLAIGHDYAINLPPKPS
jgi:TfoX/Sxy family transcriptional regulator of competence genes